MSPAEYGIPLARGWRRAESRFEPILSGVCDGLGASLSDVREGIEVSTRNPEPLEEISDAAVESGSASSGGAQEQFAVDFGRVMEADAQAAIEQETTRMRTLTKAIETSPALDASLLAELQKSRHVANLERIDVPRPRPLDLPPVRPMTSVASWIMGPGGYQTAIPEGAQSLPTDPPSPYFCTVARADRWSGELSVGARVGPDQNRCPASEWPVGGDFRREAAYLHMSTPLPTLNPPVTTAMVTVDAFAGEPLGWLVPGSRQSTLRGLVSASAYFTVRLWGQFEGTVPPQTRLKVFERWANADVESPAIVRRDLSVTQFARLAPDAPSLAVSVLAEVMVIRWGDPIGGIAHLSLAADDLPLLEPGFQGQGGIRAPYITVTLLR